MDFSQLNLLAVIVAAVASFVLGGLWYSVLFGKAWQRETGITDEKAKQANMAKTFGLSFVAALVIAFNLAMFFGPDQTLASGALFGFLAGFGWVAMAFGINDLFEQRSLRLWAINAGYHSLSFTVMGAIIGVWH